MHFTYSGGLNPQNIKGNCDNPHVWMFDAENKLPLGGAAESLPVVDHVGCKIFFLDAYFSILHGLLEQKTHNNMQHDDVSI